MSTGPGTADGSRAGFDDRDRRALRSVAVQFFVNGALFASFMPRLPEIRDRVDVSVAGIGLLLSVAGAVGLIGSAAVGPAIARWGTRPVILVSSAAVSAALALVGIATHPAVLLIGLAGMLTFDVLVDVGMNTQGSWLSARRHAPVMNRLHGLWSLGTLLGGVVSSRIAAAGVGLTTHLLGAAVVLFAMLAYVGPGLLPVDEAHAGADDPPDDEDESAARTRRRVSALTLVAFGASGFFAIAMESGSTDWAAFRLSDDFGSGPGVAALAYVAVTLGMTTARFAGDWASVRLGDRRLRMVSLAAVGGGLAVASFAPTEPLVLLGYLAAGLGNATLLPTMYDQAAKHPGRPGAGLGALTAGIRIAILGVPVGIGALARELDDVGTAVALVTLPSVIGFFLATRRVAPRV